MNTSKSATINEAIKKGREVFVRVPGQSVDFCVLGARTRGKNTQVRFENCYFNIGDAVAYATGKCVRSAVKEPLW